MVNMNIKKIINVKGQMQQTFIYILVILVVGVVLLLGFKSIGKIMGQSCEAEEATFRLDLQQMLDKNARYGVVANPSLRAPCKYEYLCFATNNTHDDFSDSSKPVFYGLIKTELDVGTGNNVFGVKGNTIVPLMALDNLEVASDGFFCVSNRGNKFYLRLEGQSRGIVRVSEQI